MSILKARGVSSIVVLMLVLGMFFGMGSNAAASSTHDLSIVTADISFSDPDPTMGETIQIDAVIRNIGETSIIFEDSFEDNLDKWTKLYGTATRSTTQSHSGDYSYVINEDVEAIRHIFPDQIEGKVEIWFYDSLSSSAQSICGIDNEIPGIGAFSLGVVTYFSSDYYIYQVGSWWGTKVTSIPRTLGWHKFEFISDGAKSTSYIDNNLVATTTQFKTFNRIDLGDWWGNGYYMTTYIDDIKVYDYSQMTEITAKVAFYDGDPADSGILLGYENIEFLENTMVETSILWETTLGNHDIYVRIENINPSDLVESNNIASKSIIVRPIPAIIDIDPDELNLKSKGKWVTGYIELPEGYDVNDIDVSTIELNDAVSAELSPTNISDYDNDDITDLMIKFDRAEVIRTLEVGEDVEILITGEMDNIEFKGYDYIDVVDE
jgi:hypothetical protein